MTKARRGIYAAAITPFDENGRVMTDKLVSYCKHLLSDGGCDGVAPTGTTGEGTSIAKADRLALPEAFADAGIEMDRVIFGTGAPSLPDCVAITSAACEAGYVNALVLPPYYYKSPSDDGLFAYYAKLIEQVGRDDLRIFLYHFPQMSQVPISTDLVLRLRQAFGPIIAGLKDSSGDFDQSRAFIEATGGVAQDFDVYPSSEAFLWDGLSIGSAGIISGSTNLTARAVQEAKKAPEGTARDAAMEKVRAARTTAAKYPLMAAMKTAECWRSGDDSWLTMQPPLTPLTEELKAQLKDDLSTITAT
ncbi:dihydrodipicolinate synthase family protein [Gymnodinialimonas ceratoperidinii]|uniref:Dihydrodipicolinate synthase family protein n=1 Tax=Gymnodinialimonas ceratoperidinii TaxID=2856823 RepID=A0A8F6TUP5_9RHOB|nr:dihydrodipicolinate synthase family protein [Gymnodinialimonas ceratoperidinii]QXT38193.1 dihydrodipicolinate synthase family protein [Gymnodinialimonas ceratoperidinii]